MKGLLASESNADGFRLARIPKKIPVIKNKNRIPMIPSLAMDKPFSDGIKNKFVIANRDSKAAVKKNHGQY